MISQSAFELLTKNSLTLPVKCIIGHALWQVRIRYYSLSILKRQLERGLDVLLRCQMSHVYTIIFYNTYIFARNIF